MQNKKQCLPSDIKRKRIIKIIAKTNPNYGKNPKERSINELFENGIINLDKPSGPSSHQVDSWVKKIFNIQKVGHHGTLDPNATGVLPVAVGDATKALQALLPNGKEYIAILKLHKTIDEKKIKEAFNSFVGEITQLPPVRSAVKRVKRKRRIYYLQIIEINDRDVLFKVGCESGTYVRTLCVDIAKKLGIRGHLSQLRRSRVGPFFEDDSNILQDVKDAFVFYQQDNDEKHLRNIIFPIEKLFEGLPKIIIRDSAVDAVCHGANLAVPGVVEIDSDIKNGELAAVLTLKQEAVALVKMLMDTKQIVQKDKGVCASLERVVMKKGTYPPIWKKS